MGNNNSLIGFPPEEVDVPSTPSVSSNTSTVLDIQDLKSTLTDPFQTPSPRSSVNDINPLFRRSSSSALSTLNSRSRISKRKRRYSLRREMVKRVANEGKPSSISIFSSSHHSDNNSRYARRSGRDSDLSSNNNSTSKHQISSNRQIRRLDTNSKSRCLPFLSPSWLNRPRSSTNRIPSSSMQVSRTTHDRLHGTQPRFHSTRKQSFFRSLFSPLGTCLRGTDYTMEDDHSVVTTTENGTTHRSHHMSSNSEGGHLGGMPVYFSSGDHLDEYTNNSSLSESRMMKDTFKVIILGSSGVGKSSLVGVFENMPFNANNLPTIGIQFSTIECPCDCGKTTDSPLRYSSYSFDPRTIKLQFYDASGRIDDDERQAIFYEDVDAVLFMYSDIQSFKDISSIWYKEFCKYTPISDQECVVKILVGNKVDTRDHALDLDQSIENSHELYESDSGNDTFRPRVVLTRNPSRSNFDYITYKDGAQLAEKLGCQFFECSARTGQNTSIILSTLSSRLQSNLRGGYIDEESEETYTSRV